MRIVVIGIDICEGKFRRLNTLYVQSPQFYKVPTMTQAYALIKKTFLRLTKEWNEPTTMELVKVQEGRKTVRTFPFRVFN